MFRIGFEVGAGYHYMIQNVSGVAANDLDRFAMERGEDSLAVAVWPHAVGEVPVPPRLANEINDRSVVVEFVTDARENVFPMVPAGATNSEVVVDPSQQHLLDGGAS